MKGLTVGQLIKILKEEDANSHVFYSERFGCAKAIGSVGIGGHYKERMVILGGLPDDQNSRD